jgi:hypothetical protein
LFRSNYKAYYETIIKEGIFLNGKTKETDGRSRSGALAIVTNNIGEKVSDSSSKVKNISMKTRKSIEKTANRRENEKENVEQFRIGEENFQKAIKVAKNIPPSVMRNAKSANDVIEKAINDTKFEIDKRTLRPVFEEELSLKKSHTSNAHGIRKTKNYMMISIVERDRKRSESDACSGAIGYLTRVKGIEILNIYGDSIHRLEMQFYPNISNTIYYVDPFKENVYISLDDYFDYIKKARINELEMIAQSLGAESVQIKFKERKKTLVARKAHADAKVDFVRASTTVDKTDAGYSSVEIAADVKFSGHNVPVKPKLVYFKNESDIIKLVQMRTKNSGNKIESKTYKFQCSKSSVIKEKDAAQIDAALTYLKLSGTASISNEVQRESRTELEYSIVFPK